MRRAFKSGLFPLMILIPLVLTGCSDDGNPEPPPPEYPEIVDAVAERSHGRFTVTVTVSSPYDSSERWADAVRVLDSEHEPLHVHEFDHPHPTEQPFTRSIPDVGIPIDVTEIHLQARDSSNGWSPTTFDIDLDQPEIP
ncbi:hypothetical protein [Haloglycomyces albus]|uniref:hypothetical protein n=1 Tax=Haloglycomyces albus TaxID=526067 RepID=UPI00046D7C6C|nr:hypothetical protein [Haloglycomyces albus]